MNTQELIRNILLRLNRLKLAILAGGILMAALFFLYAYNAPALYSVKATVFTLTAAPDNAASRLSEIFGAGNAKSPTDEANVSIEEVGKSRKTRGAVVSVRLPAYGNKMVAEVMINEYNKKRSFFSSEIKMPKSDSDIIRTGIALIAPRYKIKFNKTGLLEITFSSTDRNLLIPVEYLLIEKVSRFYKELKTEKANSDYEFVQAKVDSFEYVLRSYDRRLIKLDKTTLFVPGDRVEYALPKANLNNDKARVLGQRNGAAANREEALWRLQKETPIIKILDQPNVSDIPIKPSSKIYAAVGFFIGCLLFSFLFIVGLLYRFVNAQISAALTPKTDPHMNTTA
ncbi:MAG: hypothetical protein WKF88_11860 [Ferruginibacter sp.]